MGHNKFQIFLLKLRIVATNELQKEFPDRDISKEKRKNKKNAKKKKTTGTPTPNNLKGPTITKPKALPF